MPVKALEFEEDFKTLYEDYGGFGLNVKEDSQGYSGIFIQFFGNTTGFKRISSTGEKLLDIDLSDSSVSDYVETSDGNYLIYRNISTDTLTLISPSGEQLKTSTLSEGYSSYTGGRLLFKIENAIILVLNSSSGTAGIVLDSLDNEGTIKDTKFIENYGILGMTSSSNKVKILASKDNEFYLINVAADLSYDETKLDASSLTDDEKSQMQSFYNTFTSLVMKDEDIYFASSYGIFAIQDNKITKVVDGDRENVEKMDFTSLAVVKDTFIGGGITTDDSGNTRATIQIFDSKFNILDTIYLNDSFDVSADNELSIVKCINSTTNGFLVSGMVSESAFVIKYKVKYDISTKTDGNGTISVSTEKEYTGNQVTFKITANEGYELNEVKVTDANGNVLVFTDYTFTMPNADVTIEATFMKKEANPDTSDIFIIASITIVIGTLISYLNIKKMKELS